jgi:hypothetical protein
MTWREWGSDPEGGDCFIVVMRTPKEGYGQQPLDISESSAFLKNYLISVTMHFI